MKKVLPLRQACVAILMAALAAGIATAADEPASQPATQPAAATQPAPADMPAESTDAPTTGKIVLSGSKDDGEGNTGLGGPGDDLTGAAWQMLSAALVVLVLGVVAIVVIKKLLPRINRATGRRISVLETTYLAPRKAVHLVQVGSRKLLLASSQENVIRLDDVTDAFGSDYAEVARRVEARTDRPDDTEESRPRD